MASHDTSKTHGTHGGTGEQKPAGVGLGVGVDLNLQLGGLKSALDMLTDALKETGETATDLITNAVNKIREFGPEQFKQFKGKEGEQGDLYDRTVSNLRKAADRGESEAREMLNKLGEGVEHTGEKMQSKSHEGQSAHGGHHEEKGTSH